MDIIKEEDKIEDYNSSTKHRNINENKANDNKKIKTDIIRNINNNK